MSTGSNEFKDALQMKRNELLLGTFKREEIRIENTAEEFDRVQERMNRELAIRNLDRESKLLKSLEEAIARIQAGAFGICLYCEEEIPEKRLKAVPWASHCVRCQEKIDRRRAVDELDDDIDAFKSAA
jgi:DnaK suppressor protein